MATHKYGGITFQIIEFSNLITVKFLGNSNTSDADVTVIGPDGSSFRQLNGSYAYELESASPGGPKQGSVRIPPYNPPTQGSGTFGSSVQSYGGIEYQVLEESDKITFKVLTNSKDSDIDILIESVEGSSFREVDGSLAYELEAASPGGPKQGSVRIPPFTGS